MGTASLIVIAVVVVMAILVLGLWLLWTANRLDKLHLRCEAARATLEEQALRRAVAAQELASSGTLDIASAVLLSDAAAAAREAGVDARWQAESDLTSALHIVVLPADGAESTELSDASRRLTMARRIHNDVAATTTTLRGRRLVRRFRLGGRAPAPQTIAFDDRVRSETRR